MFDPRREKEMLEGLVAANPGPFRDETIRALFKEIFKASLAFMQRKGVANMRVLRKPDDEDLIIDCGKDIRFGAAAHFMAGPCSVEGYEGLEKVASALRAEGVRFLRGGAFKPRTSPYSFQGMGEEGLLILADVAKRNNMVCVTEVLDTRSAELVAKHADVLQIGTRNMSNFELLKVVGGIQKPVLLKRAFSATIDELLSATEYLFAAGNDQVILCERGIRTFERLTRNTLDISAVPLLKLRTRLPVLVDVSHAAGRKDLLLPLSAAALAAGAHGVMIEVHHDPVVARSDGEQQLTVEEFSELAQALRRQMPSVAPVGPAKES
jgi:3-deoxy-7-phosphoheptulonate synthase/chorismate mutase